MGWLDGLFGSPRKRRARRRRTARETSFWGDSEPRKRAGRLRRKRRRESSGILF